MTLEVARDIEKGLEVLAWGEVVRDIEKGLEVLAEGVVDAIVVVGREGDMASFGELCCWLDEDRLMTGNGLLGICPLW